MQPTSNKFRRVRRRSLLFEIEISKNKTTVKNKLTSTVAVTAAATTTTANVERFHLRDCGCGDEEENFVVYFQFQAIFTFLCSIQEEI